MQDNLIAPILRGAGGGLSDDLFVGIDGSFFSSKNIEIRENARSISLTKALVKDSASVVVERVDYILKLADGHFLGFGNAGGIYRKVSGSWAKVVTDSPASAILGACEFNGYIYWATAGQLHRILKTNVSNDISATDVINWQALETSTRYPMLVRTGEMFIGNGKFVSNIDIGNVFNQGLTIESNTTILFLDMLGTSIRALGRKDLSGDNIFLLAKDNKEISQTIPLIGYLVKGSMIYNGMHYLVTNKGLGVLDGYNVFNLKQTTVLNGDKGGITVFDNKIFLSGAGGVYCFGAKSKNYTQVLNLQHTTSNGNVADDIGAVFSDGADLYIGWKQGTSHGIDKLSTTVFASSGELITRGYYANSLHEVKEALNVMFGYKKLLVNESLKVSYSYDGGSYTELVTLTSTTPTKELFTEDIFIQGKFQYVQFKFELGGNGTTTPEIYVLLLRFKNNTKR